MVLDESRGGEAMRNSHFGFVMNVYMTETRESESYVKDWYSILII